MKKLINTALVAGTLLATNLIAESNCYDAKNVEGLYPLHQTICLDGFYNIETKYSKKEQLVFWNNVKNQLLSLLEDDVNITIQPKEHKYFMIYVEDYPINVYFDNNKTI